MEELLKSTISQSGLTGSQAKKAYKKALKKVESNGGYSRVLDSLGQNSASNEGEDGSGDIRSRLREKIKQQKMIRSGTHINNNHYQKEEKKAKSKAIDILNSESNKSKGKNKAKMENLKLNKLEKKLGTISLDLYQDTVSKLDSNNNLSNDETIYYQRIINLYRRQNNISASDKAELDELDDLLN